MPKTTNAYWNFTTPVNLHMLTGVLTAALKNKP